MEHRVDPKKRNPDGTWPDDECYLDGMPYSIVDRQMVRKTAVKVAKGVTQYLEYDAYMVGTLVPR